MDADAVLQISAQQSIGICVPQVRLAEEGELFDVIHGFDIIRRETSLFHQMTVIGDVVPDMVDLFDELFILDFQDFFPWGRFNFRLVISLHKRSLLCDVAKLCRAH